MVTTDNRLQDLTDICTPLVEQKNETGLELNKKRQTLWQWQKPYNNNEYVKIGTYSFETAKLGTIVKNTIK